MSRDYSPIELIDQARYGFRDFWLGDAQINSAPRLPEAIPLAISRDRTVRTHGEEVGFHPLQGSDIWSDPVKYLGQIPSDGLTHGAALNLGYLNESMAIKVGRFSEEYNESFPGELPIPDGTWVHYGDWPGRPLWDDRSAAFVLPNGHIVHIWQWLSRPGEYAITPNHAASIGMFDSKGNIIGGTGGSTAAKTSWAMTTDTPESMDPEDESNWGLSSGMACAYPLIDRLGRTGDGILERRLLRGDMPPIDVNGRPLHLRDILLLKKDSETYERNYNLGGHCRVRAIKHARYGLMIDDQRGLNGSHDTGVARAPFTRTQACSDWHKNKSNLKEFSFKLEDYTLANEQELNFTPYVPMGSTTPTDPQNPTPTNPGGSGAGCMPGSTLIAKLWKH